MSKNRTRSLKESATSSEQIQQWAKQWANTCVPGDPAYAPAEAFVWSEDRTFDLHKIAGWDAGEYDFLYEEEKERDSEGETPVTYFDEMCDAIKNHTIEEIFVAEGTDGKFYVWEGNHRVGMAHVLGVDIMPAFVGHRKLKNDLHEILKLSGMNVKEVVQETSSNTLTKNFSDYLKEEIQLNEYDYE